MASWRAPQWRWFAAANAGSLLIAPHVYGYDAGILLLPIWLAIYNATDLGTKLAATALATPIPFLMTLAGKPWAAAAPIVIIIFLANLAIRNLPKRTPQTRDAFENPPDRTSG
jgi:cell division protein FtsW (lipid II flippase)